MTPIFSEFSFFGSHDYSLKDVVTLDVVFSIGLVQLWE